MLGFRSTAVGGGGPKEKRGERRRGSINGGGVGHDARVCNGGRLTGMVAAAEMAMAVVESVDGGDGDSGGRLKVQRRERRRQARSSVIAVAVDG